MNLCVRVTHCSIWFFFVAQKTGLFLDWDVLSKAGHWTTLQITHNFVGKISSTLCVTENKHQPTSTFSTTSIQQVKQPVSRWAQCAFHLCLASQRNDTIFVSFAWHFLETHGMLRWPFLVSADIEEYGHDLSRPWHMLGNRCLGQRKKNTTWLYMCILRL